MSAKVFLINCSTYNVCYHFSDKNVDLVKKKKKKEKRYRFCTCTPHVSLNLEKES